MRARHRAVGRIGQTHCADDHPPFTPPIPTNDILRELVVKELRSGRLTPARRKDMSRYALQFGLSLAQANGLIATVERDAARSGETPEPTTRRVVRDCPRHPPVKPMAYVIAGALLILLDVAIVALT